MPDEQHIYVAGEPGRLEWIPVDQLAVDITYQRDTGSRKSLSLIKHLVNEFDWTRLQPLILAERSDGNGLYVVDGQHRLTAAIQCNILSLPCYIIKSNDISDEAQSFVGINKNRMNMTTIQIYHAEIAAGDELSLRVKKVCDSAAITVPRSNGNGRQSKGDVLTCPGRIKRCIKSFGDETVLNALIALVEAGAEHSNYLSASMVEGTCLIYSAYQSGDNFDPDRFIETIASKDNEAWREASQNFRSFERVSVASSFANVFLKQYNHGLQSQNRLSL
jgi:hypothetical protein